MVQLKAVVAGAGEEAEEESKTTLGKLNDAKAAAELFTGILNDLPDLKKQKRPKKSKSKSKRRSAKHKHKGGDKSVTFPELGGSAYDATQPQKLAFVAALRRFGKYPPKGCIQYDVDSLRRYLSHNQVLNKSNRIIEHGCQSV